MFDPVAAAGVAEPVPEEPAFELATRVPLLAVGALPECECECECE